MDNCALSDVAKTDIIEHYPKARRAELKSGGNFPFLSRSAEVDLHIKVKFLIVNRSRIGGL